MTGVLPVAIEEATKVVQALLVAGKEYVCVMRLHGEVPRDRVERVLKEFEGAIYQRPPLRASVKRRLRTRLIYYLDLLEADGRDVLFRVGCEGGTYIRKLCVPGDTELILHNGGIRKIKELDDEALNTPSRGLFTISMNDLKVERGEITRLYKLPAPNKLIRITTDSGVPVTVTPDHEVLVSTVDGPEWVPACSLKGDEFVYSPRKIPVERRLPYIVDLLDDEICVADQRIRDLCIEGIRSRFGSVREMNRRLGIDRNPFYSSSKMGIRIKHVKSLCDWDEVKKLISSIKTERGRVIRLHDKQVTYDLMYLLGLIASSGRVIQERGHIRPNRIKLRNSDEKLIRGFIRIYKKIFHDTPIHLRRFGGNTEVDTNNPVLGGVAYSLGIRSPETFMDLNGIFALPEELVKGFLKGYFDGGGSCYVRKKGERTYTTIEFRTRFQVIAKRLYQLLKRVGIRSKIFRRGPAGAFGGGGGHVYAVRIVSPVDKWRFIEEIGSSHSQKEGRLRAVREHLKRRGVTNSDHVPLHVNRLIESLLAKNNIKKGSLKLGRNLERALKYKKAMTKHLLSRVIERLSRLVKESEIKSLLPILNSDFYVERVRSIEEVDSREEYVYDVRVERTHNFVPEGVMVVSNCHDIGEALGCGAHMQELRRTRSGPFSEGEACFTLHDVCYLYSRWEETGDEGLMKRFILPMEHALKLVPKIYVRDSAVDAVCHGAHLAAPGVLSLETGIKPNDSVAIFTQKGEAVALSKALASTEQILKMDHGFVAKTKRVLMPRGVYPKMWRTSL